MLFHTISRAKEASLIDDVIVICPEELPDVPTGIDQFIFSGDESDVLGRYHAALKRYPCDYIVRLTSDCPLLDPNLIDLAVHSAMDHDYCSNVLVPTFPDGLDVEVISADTIKMLHRDADKPYDREHVTTMIRNNSYIQRDMDLVSIESEKDYSYIKISVDTAEDLDRVREYEKCLTEKQSC